MDMQNRFMSKVAWTSIVAHVLAILVAFGVITPEISDLARNLAVAALELIGAFGVFNNPTSKDNF